MRKPNNYETTQAYGNFEALELGGHICRICKVVETKSKKGADMLEIWLDIGEGPQRDYYLNQWRRDDRPEKKWPCIVYQLVEDEYGKTNKGYKTFIEAATKSNAGFLEDKLWEENGAEYLKGKQVGGVFGREQYLNSKNELKWSIKCVQFRDIETIRKGVEIPEDKVLKGQSTRRLSAGFETLDTEDNGDLPF